MFLTRKQKENLAERLAKLAPREMVGETIEAVIADILDGATLLPKDKKWFDIVQHDRGLEVKSFIAGSPLEPGSVVYNVLKRVSKVESKNKAGKLLSATLVGSKLIDYLNDTIEQHALLKKIPEHHQMAVLFRTHDARNFAYWEQPLAFEPPENYVWSWNKGETLQGKKGAVAIFQWYSKNQKQLFFRFEVPPDADLFEVRPVRMVSLSEDELEKRLRKSYRKGYQDGARGHKME